VLGVDEEHRRAAVLDDVGDLVCLEAEVDRDDDPAARGRPVEEVEHARGVRADDRDPLARADAERVESGGDRVGARGDVGEGQRAEARGGLVGLVDDRDALGVDRRAAREEVTGGERDEHLELLFRGHPAHTTAMGASTDARAASTTARPSAGRWAARHAGWAATPDGPVMAGPSIASPQPTQRAPTWDVVAAVTGPSARGDPSWRVRSPGGAAIRSGAASARRRRRRWSGWRGGWSWRRSFAGVSATATVPARRAAGHRGVRQIAAENRTALSEACRR
jgi:hypothetical protein